MAESTYEEATRCPKCGKPGEVKEKRVVPRSTGLPVGTMVHTVYCRTTLCPWENTPWMVQVNADGSVPPPQDHTNSKKHYAGFEGHEEEARAVLEAMRRTQAASTEPGAELRNPNAR